MLKALLSYNKGKESKKIPTKVEKWLNRLSIKIAHQNTRIDYWALEFFFLYNLL